jgi:hypothetical protein
LPLTVDARDEAQVRAALDNTSATFCIDIVVNNGSAILLADSQATERKNSATFSIYEAIGLEIQPAKQSARSFTNGLRPMLPSSPVFLRLTPTVECPALMRRPHGRGCGKLHWPRVSRADSGFVVISTISGFPGSHQTPTVTPRRRSN